MFKLPNPPSPMAGAHELADFVETRCWIDTITDTRWGLSETEVVKALVRMADNERNSGCDDDEDAIRDRIGEAMDEINRRSSICKDGYPFFQDRNGSVLKLAPRRKGRQQKDIYLYLLLCTRLNMKNNRKHASLDGTLLLEQLSGHVLQEYLGPNSRSMLFGATAGGVFRSRVTDLCSQLGEGGTVINRASGMMTAQDGGLDTVGWIPFADRMPGQLIVFGQCKTGTSWRDDTTKLRPSAFNKKWMSDTFAVDPLRAFFVAESVDPSRWENVVIDAGILFDRCRLVEHSRHLASNIFADISKWTQEARKWLAKNF